MVYRAANQSLILQISDFQHACCLRHVCLSSSFHLFSKARGISLYQEFLALKWWKLSMTRVLNDGLSILTNYYDIPVLFESFFSLCFLVFVLFQLSCSSNCFKPVTFLSRKINQVRKNGNCTIPSNTDSCIEQYLLGCRKMHHKDDLQNL